ncbi:hypothetical protein ACUTAF_15340 [Pseudomonas sp. SP16.1]|uniref:hypothetical protein n=1 Tax=Pseudomonas sp. SP16.1 TaxID=3458854 RepID=UPI0040459244
MIKSIVYMALVLTFEHAVGANPLATIDEDRRGRADTGGAGGETWMWFVFALIPVGFWLVCSDSSPIKAWADKNKMLAYLFLTFFPATPGVLYFLLR